MTKQPGSDALSEKPAVSVPRTPVEMIEFIGSNFNSRHDYDDHGNELPKENVCFSLTVHDLLSAFAMAGFHDDEQAAIAPCVDEQAAPACKASALHAECQRVAHNAIHDAIYKIDDCEPVKAAVRDALDSIDLAEFSAPAAPTSAQGKSQGTALDRRLSQLLAAYLDTVEVAHADPSKLQSAIVARNAITDYIDSLIGEQSTADSAQREPVTPLEKAIEADRVAYEASLPYVPSIRTKSNAHPWGWCYADDNDQKKFREFCNARTIQ